MIRIGDARSDNEAIRCGNAVCGTVRGKEKVMTDDIEEFKKSLQSQKKKVDEKINPILKLFDDGKITKMELIEKLADAFYRLEKECESG